MSEPNPTEAGPAKPASSSGPAVPLAALPPNVASMRQQTADEVLQAMNKMPLFMTTLDETDEQGGENVALEAMKALAYEGTRAEIAQNFKEQGNELARAKKWADAKELYSKALAALKAPAEQSPEEVDEVAQKKLETELEETCHVNRALCHLELSNIKIHQQCVPFAFLLTIAFAENFRSCNIDCAAALRLNPSNVKALYRSASACFALDKIPEAEDACYRGLDLDRDNASLKKLALKLHERKADLAVIARKRQEREDKKAAEARTLAKALRDRNIRTRTTGRAPDLEDAVMKLSVPENATSKLTLPVVLLYPLHLQSDFIKSFQETETLSQHLAYIFPLPWDEGAEFSPKSVDCYVETPSGGLIKVGKNMALRDILKDGRVEVVDGIVTINVVPSSRASQWIADFKKQRIV